METSSLLSSLNDECKSDNYIEPHYKEWYRVAIDTLIEHGLEAYQEFLAKERVSDFLAEEEINYILKNVQKIAQSTTHGTDNSCDDTSSSGTYWPIESDVEAPDLDLGWPYVMPGLLGGTHIDLLFHPPRAQLLTIKETIRKMIKEARKVILFLFLNEISETVGKHQNSIPHLHVKIFSICMNHACYFQEIYIWIHGKIALFISCKYLREL